MVWKSNDELLALAETVFDVLVTIDANLRHQQNPSGRKIAIVILLAAPNRLEDLRPHFAACAGTISTIKPEDMVQVGNPG